MYIPSPYIIPLCSMALLSLLPSEYNTIKLTVLIAAAAPVGSNVAIFAQINNLDYTQAVKDICISTYLCIFTIPIIVGFARFIMEIKYYGGYYEVNNYRNIRKHEPSRGKYYFGSGNNKARKRFGSCNRFFTSRHL